MGYTTSVTAEGLTHLTRISRFLSDRLNRQPDPYAAYVGASAFAHKGGLHVSAMAKSTSSYEHIAPEIVGNSRTILISDQAGKSNIISRLTEIGMVFDPKDERLNRLVQEIKELEHHGYSYDSADASFELLAQRTLSIVPNYFMLQTFRVIDERRYNAKGELTTLSEATIKLKVGGRTVMSVAEGNGPVNALDTALRKALRRKYPQLADLQLVDYKVRIVNSGSGTKALTRVLIESMDNNGHRWTTIGVSTNIIDASYNALYDSITYRLLKSAPAVPSNNPSS
jgi:2-isopropylmalate synthase